MERSDFRLQFSLLRHIWGMQKEDEYEKVCNGVGSGNYKFQMYTI